MSRCKSEFSLYINRAGRVAVKVHAIGEEGQYKPTTEGEAKALMLDVIAFAEERGVPVATQALFLPALKLPKGTKSVPVKDVKRAVAEAQSIAFMVGQYGPYVGVLTDAPKERAGEKRTEKLERRTGVPGVLTRRSK